MRARVYLPDLRHAFCGIIASDCIPLGIGYMKTVMDARPVLEALCVV